MPDTRTCATEGVHFGTLLNNANPSSFLTGSNKRILGWDIVLPVPSCGLAEGFVEYQFLVNFSANIKRGPNNVPYGLSVSDNVATDSKLFRIISDPPQKYLGNLVTERISGSFVVNGLHEDKPLYFFLPDGPNFETMATTDCTLSVNYARALQTIRVVQ